MRIVLMNPPHPSIGSRIPREHLPPLGLLSVGGGAAGSGALRETGGWGIWADEGGGDGGRGGGLRRGGGAGGAFGVDVGAPVGVPGDAGGAGAAAGAKIIYGGVFPTYHWREVMEEPVIDYVVRGEGERTIGY